MKNKITIDLDKMKKGWFGETQQYDYLWEVVEHKGKVYEIRILDNTDIALATRLARIPIPPLALISLFNFPTYFIATCYQ